MVHMHGAVVWVVERDLCLELLLVRVVEECDVSKSAFADRMPASNSFSFQVL